MQGPRPEIGTTTGRPRRTGWFDAVASRYSVALNSVNSVALTRLDVLDPFPSIQICTAYKIDGATVTSPPASITAFERAVAAARGDARLDGRLHERPQVRGPAGERAEATSCASRSSSASPIDIVSVGPEREQVIIRNGFPKKS